MALLWVVREGARAVAARGDSGGRWTFGALRRATFRAWSVRTRARVRWGDRAKSLARRLWPQRGPAADRRLLQVLYAQLPSTANTRARSCGCGGFSLVFGSWQRTADPSCRSQWQRGVFTTAGKRGRHAVTPLLTV